MAGYGVGQQEMIRRHEGANSSRKDKSPRFKGRVAQDAEMVRRCGMRVYEMMD